MSEGFSQTARQELTNVISSREEFVYCEAEGAPLLVACAFIAEAMGFRLPAEKISTTPTLEEICRTADIRYREIELEEEWWKSDHGHFLGFTREDNEPIAVLRSSKQYYEMVFPKTKKKIRVDAQTSQQLDRTAYMFHPPLPINMSSFRALLKILFQKKQWDYFSLGLTGLLVVLLGFFFPVANQILFDYVIPNFNLNAFYQILIGFLVAATASAIFLYARSIVILRLNGIIGNHTQISLWDRLLKTPVSFFRNFELGDIIQRTVVFEEIRRELNQHTLVILFDSLFSILYFFIMMAYSWKLSLIVLGVLLVAGVFFVIIFIPTLYYSRLLLNSDAKINSFLVQAIYGINKLRVAAAENKVLSKWAHEFSLNQKMGLRVGYFHNMLATLNSVLGIALSLLIYSAIIWTRHTEMTSHAIFSEFSIGIFLAFVAAYVPFAHGVFDFITTSASIAGLVPFWERVRPLLNTTPLETSPDKGVITELHGDIKAEHVYFRYDKKMPMLLQDLSFHAKAGEFIGIVGKSGSGKSTFCRLLIGFEIPERGRILYDDRDLTELNLAEFRKHVGILLQKSAIFSGNIYKNLVCGKKYTEEEIVWALKFSLFEEDLKRFPSGLQTLLPIGGGLLSGGEKQRLLLARILLTRPKVIILDESLSSLDNVTQQRIIHNLKSLGITVVAISHHFNLLKEANRLYVMDQGRFRESGTFEELLQKDGLFKHLYDKQLI